MTDLLVAFVFVKIALADNPLAQINGTLVKVSENVPINAEHWITVWSYTNYMQLYVLTIFFERIEQSHDCYVIYAITMMTILLIDFISIFANQR